MTYEPTVGVPDASRPRVFVAFEDRHRDLTGLLEFGTVVTIFTPRSPWQVVTSERAALFWRAACDFFRQHEFNAKDFVVAVGDPVVITMSAIAAAMQDHGRVNVLKWDRLPCESCGLYRKACANATCPRLVRGRYVAVRLVFDA